MGWLDDLWDCAFLTLRPLIVKLLLKSRADYHAIVWQYSAKSATSPELAAQGCNAVLDLLNPAGGGLVIEHNAVERHTRRTLATVERLDPFAVALAGVVYLLRAWLASLPLDGHEVVHCLGEWVLWIGQGHEARNGLNVVVTYFHIDQIDFLAKIEPANLVACQAIACLNQCEAMHSHPRMDGASADLGY